ncbi:phospholipase A2, membrane associated-like [Ctenodactylus gundi]
MKTLLLLTVLMASGLMCAHGHIGDFWRMIWLTTHREPFYNYGFYGCHCGLGGRGAPKDETDWCCVRHDCCYSKLKKQKCGTKFLSYKFRKSGGQIICDANQSSCQRQLCQCDKVAAECFARNQNTYNKKYQAFPNWKCSGRKPSC